MTPRRLRTKHRIVQPSLGKRPYNEVYYQWLSGEEDIGKEDKAEEVEGSHNQEGHPAMPMEETTEKGDDVG
jgi:hypothetical protein